MNRTKIRIHLLCAFKMSSAQIHVMSSEYKLTGGFAALRNERENEKEARTHSSI